MEIKVYTVESMLVTLRHNFRINGQEVLDRDIVQRPFSIMAGDTIEITVPNSDFIRGSEELVMTLEFGNGCEKPKESTDALQA